MMNNSNLIEDILEDIMLILSATIVLLASYKIIVLMGEI